MTKRIITAETIATFKSHLIEEEKSAATIEKYIRDVTAFAIFVADRNVEKELVVSYKEKITAEYAVTSVNSMLSSINSILEFLGWYDCRVKQLKIQREIYRSVEKDLTEEEYKKLVRTAEKNGKQQLSLILQTIAATGMRISELRFVTLKALKRGEAIVKCKGKNRKVFILPELCETLKKFAKDNNIRHGAVFLDKFGKPIHRTTVWRQMKSLCKSAQISPSKVFPHNLRHLFAKVYYRLHNDIAKLADILGHSSINTTRIYLVSTGDEHKKQIEQMRLLVTNAQNTT